MKSVAYVAPNNLSVNSAAVINIMEMCNALSKNGYKTRLFAPRTGQTSRHLHEFYGIAFPFEIIEIDIPRIFSEKLIPGLETLFPWLVLNRFRKTRNDIVFTRSPWFFFIASRLCKKASVFEAHQFRFERKCQPYVYRLLVKLGSRSRDAFIVCISKRLMHQWAEYGIGHEKMVVVHDAVNLSKFKTMTSKKASRQQLGIDQDAPIVVYTGSLNPGKGVDILMKCANRLPDTTFVVVGGTDAKIREMRTIVNQGNVFFTGHVPPDRVPLYQTAADVLALPNTRGSVIDDVTSPLKLFEYMAAKRPVVATDMPSLSEILKPDYNALISPAGDDRKLADNIERLFQNPAIGKRLVENTVNDLEKHSWDTRVRHLIKIFNQLA